MADSNVTEPDQKRARVSWPDFLDGRVHRLKRGVHYSGPIDMINREAKLAAERLGKHAATFKDQMGKNEALWVQFLDGKIDPGEPCLRCGHTTLEKTQEYFARCANPECRALHALGEAPPAAEVEGEGDEVVYSRPAFVSLRLLTGDGEEVEEASIHEETTMELACRFPTPAARADAQLTVFRDGLRMLRADYPQKIIVPKPGIVTFSLLLTANLLPCGEYAALASMKARLRADDERAIKLNMPSGNALTFRIVDPHGPDLDELGPHRGGLHWTVTPPLQTATDW